MTGKIWVGLRPVPKARMVFLAAALVVLTAGGCGESKKEGNDALEESDFCTEITCYVDFPCRLGSFCSGETTVSRCHSSGCEAFCGTPCCSGGRCGGATEEACPEGTVCHQNGTDCSQNYPKIEASCMPPAPADASTDGGYDGWVVPDQRCEACL